MLVNVSTFDIIHSQLVQLQVKELTPEWYCNPAFLKNSNEFKLGTSQDGELLGDVVLPPGTCTSKLSYWSVLDQQRIQHG